MEGQYEKFSGKGHIRNAWAMDYLAELYIDTKEYDKAQSILEKNLKIYEKEFGHDHSLTKRVLKNMEKLDVFSEK